MLREDGASGETGRTGAGRGMFSGGIHMIRHSAAALLLGVSMLTLSAAPAMAAGPGEVSAVSAGTIVSAPALPSGAACADDASACIDTSGRTYDVSRFAVPEDTKNLVVVEGFAKNGGRDTYREENVADASRWNRARVTVYTRENAGGAWTAAVQSAAVYGWGGLSNHRHEGDGTTPIGLFRADTPFGWQPAGEGFPADYEEIMVAEHRQYWSDDTNRMEHNSDVSVQSGERLWESWAKTIYDYCLNIAFNHDYVKGTGSAIFLHCTKENKPSTAGCVAMDPRAMQAILRMYAQGKTCVAIAPAGQFEAVYGAFSEAGISPEGSFSDSGLQMPETPTVILR